MIEVLNTWQLKIKSKVTTLLGKFHWLLIWLTPCDRDFSVLDLWLLLVLWCILDVLEAFKHTMSNVYLLEKFLVNFNCSYLAKHVLSVILPLSWKIFMLSILVHFQMMFKHSLYFSYNKVFLSYTLFSMLLVFIPSLSLSDASFLRLNLNRETRGCYFFN